MNWLAHLLLSEPTPEFRLGNLLPDLVGAGELGAFSGDFARGIDCHRQIDRFTDAHPVVMESKKRLRPAFGKLAGVAVDVFYDHVLARDWRRFASVPLGHFACEVYDGIMKTIDRVPGHARVRLERMCSDDWIETYSRVSGVQYALHRIGSRLRTPLDLGEAVHALHDQGDLLADDFCVFFPRLCAHVRGRGVETPLVKTMEAG